MTDTAYRVEIERADGLSAVVTEAGHVLALVPWGLTARSAHRTARVIAERWNGAEGAPDPTRGLDMFGTNVQRYLVRAAAALALASDGVGAEPHAGIAAKMTAIAENIIAEEAEDDEDLAEYAPPINAAEKRIDGVVDTAESLGSRLYRLSGGDYEAYSAMYRQVELQARKMFTHLHVEASLPHLRRYLETQGWALDRHDFHNLAGFCCYRAPEENGEMSGPKASNAATETVTLNTTPQDDEDLAEYVPPLDTPAFKVGDRVRRKDGAKFLDEYDKGQFTATVSVTEHDSGWLGRGAVELRIGDRLFGFPAADLTPLTTSDGPSSERRV